MTQVVTVRNIVLVFGFGGTVCPAPEGFLRACGMG